MNKPRVGYAIPLLALALTASLGFNARLSYLLIDRSITKAYTDMSFERDLALRRLAGILQSEWTGMSEQKLLEQLEIFSNSLPEQDRSWPFVEEEEGSVIFDTVKFKIENGRLVAIRVPLENLENRSTTD